jgi:hypothetical protein
VLFCNCFGDPFVIDEGGAVHWLDTGTATLTRVADSLPAFEASLAGEAARDWLLPDLVQALQGEGKSLGRDQCYTYAILPVFAEGKYETWNFKPVPLREHFEVTAELHRSIAPLADGTRVRLAIERC